MSEFSKSSDAVLVIAIGRRDQAALAEVYRRHGDALFGLAWRVVGSKEHAEDILQEVILGLWRQPERFDADRGSLRSFLLMQVHGRAVDVIRSESSRAARQERAARAALEGSYDLEEDVAQEDADHRVRTALGSLRPEQRRAIGIAYFGGFTYAEVARILGEPEGTVKSRIRSGLQRMRRELNNAREMDHD